MKNEALQKHIEADGFRLRGLGFSRIDAFSDVVFGFALTLLVVSLEVPKTFSELQTTMRGFGPFAICFTFLILVWFGHYKFFRRFHLHDLGTICINAALLFVVLFFVHPLKFLFTFVIGASINGSVRSFENYRQVSSLMILFGIGFAAIYFLIGALYANAYRQREHLDLTPIERYLNRSYIIESVVVACIGLLSCVVARLLASDTNARAGYCGFTFWLIWPFKEFYGSYTRRNVNAMRAAEHLAAPLPSEIEDV